MPIRPREYLRQKNLEFKASLGYLPSTCLKGGGQLDWQVTQCSFAWVVGGLRSCGASNSVQRRKRSLEVGSYGVVSVKIWKVKHNLESGQN